MTQRIARMNKNTLTLKRIIQGSQSKLDDEGHTVPGVSVKTRAVSYNKDHNIPESILGPLLVRPLTYVNVF